MWLALHFFSWIILALLVVIGLTRQSEKRISQWLIGARLMYLVMIVSGVVLSLRTFQHAPLMISLKILLGLGTIALIEISFGRKMERGPRHLIYWLLGGLFLLTVLVGLGLHARIL